MKKTTIVGIAFLAVGVLIGVFGFYIVTDIIPVQRAKAIAQQQQEELDSMVREGDIVEITADTVKVNTGSDVITVKSNEYTTVQVGMEIKNVEDQKTDLTKFFKAGDSVSMLVKEDQVLAIYRGLTEDES